jgi:hypothetical protein
MRPHIKTTGKNTHLRSQHKLSTAIHTSSVSGGGRHDVGNGEKIGDIRTRITLRIA